MTKLQNRFAIERKKHWEPFLRMIEDGQAQCFWSSYFVCDGPGPTRDFWIACDPTKEFSFGSMQKFVTCATMFQNEGTPSERFVGGYVLLHIHYGGTKLSPEKLKPRHVNARFAFSR